VKAEAKTRALLRRLLLFGLSLVAAVAFFDAGPAEAQYIGVGPLGIYLGGHGHYRRSHRRSHRHYHRHATYHGRHHGSYRYGHRFDGGGHDVQAKNLSSLLSKQQELTVQHSLLSEWQELNAQCRGGPSNDSATSVACNKRSALDQVLLKHGCAYQLTSRDRPGDYWTCPYIENWIRAATAKPSIRHLLSEWQELNEQCRGGHGDDPATDVACSKRSALDQVLIVKGCVYQTKEHPLDYWICKD
jgi:hypothetical protein